MEVDDHLFFLEAPGDAGVVLYEARFLAGLVAPDTTIDAAVIAVAGRLALVLDGVAGFRAGILLILAELPASIPLRASVPACEQGDDNDRSKEPDHGAPRESQHRQSYQGCAGPLRGAGRYFFTGRLRAL
jgi:hypothetical protein